MELGENMSIDIPTNLTKEITDKHDVISNSFVTKEKEFETEVGDVFNKDFQPHVKIKRWDNECNFSLRLVDNDLDIPVVEVEDDKIKFIKIKKELHFYGISKEEVDNELGGYEIEIILKEKPVSNKIEFSIETKELKFYYQPELTQQEIAEGFFRSENVIGSYACYHRSKKDNLYKTGKAFHIYRPRIKDALGKEVWGELNVNETEGILVVTIDQVWLDKASYPISVDPTLGYTTAGGSNWGRLDALRGTQDTTDGNGGNINAFHVAVAAVDAVNKEVKIGVAETSGSDPAGQDVIEQVAFDVVVSDDNSIVAPSGNPLAANTEYWLGGIVEDSDTKIKYDTGSAGDGHYKTALTYANELQDPLAVGFIAGTYLWSIWVDYTAAGGLSIPRNLRLLGVGR